MVRRFEGHYPLTVCPRKPYDGGGDTYRSLSLNLVKWCIKRF